MQKRGDNYLGAFFEPKGSGRTRHKMPFGFGKTRYRSLEKNTAEVNWLVGLANLYLLRHQLMAA